MNIVLFGASGSIGTQTVDIIIKDKIKRNLTGFSVGKRVETVDKLLNLFNNVKYICLQYKKDYLVYKKKYPNVKFFYGDKGLIKLLKANEDAAVVNALVGFAGVEPSLYTISHNQTLMLANKESLVVAGELINKMLDSGKGKLIPIDSEHVAIAKCLYNEEMENVSFITITASGGPFYYLTKADLKKVTKRDALHHPTWKMGEKITIDSATMMNKTFEVIEAHYLYRLPKQFIKTVVDRNSKLHGFVTYKDGHVNLNVSQNTMEYPIRYALNEGLPSNGKYFKDVEKNTLSRYNLLPLDEERFSLMKYAEVVINEKKDSGAILNAVNEECVYAFLNNKINFVDIELIIDKIMKDVEFHVVKSYKDLKKIDQKYRKKVQEMIKESRG